MIICFNSHTIITHRNEKQKINCLKRRLLKKICFSLILISKQKTASFNLHQTSRQLPSRACKKQQQNESKRFPHLLMICFGHHSLISACIEYNDFLFLLLPYVYTFPLVVPCFPWLQNLHASICIMLSIELFLMSNVICKFSTLYFL